MSILDPAGPAAERITILFWVLVALAAGAFALIMGLFLAAFRAGGEGRASPRAFLVLGGLVFPLATLTAITVYGVGLGEAILRTGHPDPLRVEARAEQWRWQFTRQGPAGPVVRQDVLDIPAGRTVEVAITSADVIHSFWVPRLGGKMDAIPGITNRLRIEAAAPGTYQAVCAEFCGTGHTVMTFRVVAHDAAGWAALTGEAPQ